MNRRELFKFLGAAIGGIALEQAIPFNRVWSFPKKIVLANQVGSRFVGYIEGIPYYYTWGFPEYHGLTRSPAGPCKALSS